MPDLYYFSYIHLNCIIKIDRYEFCAASYNPEITKQEHILYSSW